MTTTTSEKEVESRSWRCGGGASRGKGTTTSWTLRWHAHAMHAHANMQCTPAHSRAHADTRTHIHAYSTCNARTRACAPTRAPAAHARSRISPHLPAPPRSSPQELRELLNEDETLGTSQIEEPKLEIFYAEPGAEESAASTAGPSTDTGPRPADSGGGGSKELVGMPSSLLLEPLEAAPAYAQIEVIFNHQACIVWCITCAFPCASHGALYSTYSASCGHVFTPKASTRASSVLLAY